MKFQSQHINELVPVVHYFKKCAADGTPPLLPNLRSFYFRVYESKDRSFMESGGAVMLGNAWYIWPRAVEQWIIDHAERSRGTKRAA